MILWTKLVGAIVLSQNSSLPVDDWALTSSDFDTYDYYGSWSLNDSGGCSVPEYHHHYEPTVLDDLCFGYEGTPNPTWGTPYTPIRDNRTTPNATIYKYHSWIGPWALYTKHTVSDFYGYENWHNSVLNIDAGRAMIFTIEDAVEWDLRNPLSQGGGGGAG